MIEYKSPVFASIITYLFAYCLAMYVGITIVASFVFSPFAPWAAFMILIMAIGPKVNPGWWLLVLPLPTMAAIFCFIRVNSSAYREGSLSLKASMGVGALVGGLTMLVYIVFSTKSVASLQWVEFLFILPGLISGILIALIVDLFGPIPPILDARARTTRGSR